MILVPIKSAYANSYKSLILLIVTLVLSCFVSEIRHLIGWKLCIFPIPLLFSAPALYVPSGISWCS